MVNGKTTAVRVIPRAPGTQTGDRVEFGGLLGHAPVIPGAPAKRGRFYPPGAGRIPAPLHSFAQLARLAREIPGGRPVDRAAYFASGDAFAHWAQEPSRQISSALA